MPDMTRFLNPRVAFGQYCFAHEYYMQEWQHCYRKIAFVIYNKVALILETD